MADLLLEEDADANVKMKRESMWCYEPAIDIIMQEDLNYVLPYVELLLRYRAALSPSHLASLSQKKELKSR